jgi:hypothetical protein
MEYVVTFLFGVITGVGLFGWLVMIGMRTMQDEGKMYYRDVRGKWQPRDPREQ